MLPLTILAQTPTAAPSGGGLNASTIFYLTLLFIFLTAIVTTLITKWSRDKCLKFLTGYHVTIERGRGATIWGRLKVFSSGAEVVFDHPYIDPRGRKKTSFLIYGSEIEQQVLSLLRYHDELNEPSRARRIRQIQRTFNPGPLARGWRAVRSLLNTLRDAFGAAIGAAIGQYQKVNPAGAVLGAQAGQVTSIGQTLLGKFANAYEPLLEQYIGQPVILEVADALDPNNRTHEYTGYLADYTQQFIAVFNVEHTTAEQFVISLPDVDSGPVLPPILPPPPPGGAPPILPDPLAIEHGLAIRIDGLRLKLRNMRHEPLIVRRLERDGFEPIPFGMVIPPMGMLDLPARDARGGKLFIDAVRCLDIVAPRKFATVRHAGELVERRGLADEMGLNQLPLVPKIFEEIRERTR